jgi:hypothetical protein
MFWILPQGHPHYAQAIDQQRAYHTAASPVRLQMGNYTFLGSAE